MKWLQHATNGTYLAAIIHEANDGRLPMASFTWGYIDGLGWGFLRPWEQHALFPEKGTQAGIGHRGRHHEPFWMLRWLSFDAALKHKNHDYAIEGRYWRGWVWRESFGPRWMIWRAKWVILDPDIVWHDPGKADDWGEHAGETW